MPVRCDLGIKSNCSSSIFASLPRARAVLIVLMMFIVPKPKPTAHKPSVKRIGFARQSVVI
jgi:hypothetical protein